MRCDDFASSMTKMDWAPERKKEYEVLSVCLWIFLDQWSFSLSFLFFFFLPFLLCIRSLHQTVKKITNQIIQIQKQKSKNGLYHDGPFPFVLSWCDAFNIRECGLRRFILWKCYFNKRLGYKSLIKKILKHLNQN